MGMERERALGCARVRMGLCTWASGMKVCIMDRATICTLTERGMKDRFKWERSREKVRITITMEMCMKVNGKQTIKMVKVSCSTAMVTNMLGIGRIT